MNKQTWMMVLLAVLLGIACGALHAKSVSDHKGQDLIQPEPTKYIEQSEFKELPISADVKIVNRYNDESIPDDIEDACNIYGQKYGISPEFLEALIWQESRYQADAISDDGSCIGLCQINESCHRRRMKRLGVTDLLDGRQNIAVACDYLAEIFSEHPDPAEALMVYNGDGRWKTGKISNYANQIIIKSEELKVKHERVN